MADVRVTITGGINLGFSFGLGFGLAMLFYGLIAALAVVMMLGGAR